MKWTDITFSTPAENLACDEAMLNMVEEGYGDELLRFWEPTQYFVVLGSSNRVHEEVHVAACTADNIPILRRHSGGGCVLQGPGCLNFSLILKIDPDGPTRTIPETTHYVLERHAKALSHLVGERVEHRGSSDLTIAKRKFSGNAQRRRLRALLFHGTFLMRFDIELMEKYLQQPPKQPAYRSRRSHRDFVRNVALSPAAVKQELVRAWNGEDGTVVPYLETEIARLVHTKYACSDWTYRL